MSSTAIQTLPSICQTLTLTEFSRQWMSSSTSTLTIELQYSGILTAAEISSTKIKAVLLDTVILMLDEAEPITGVYDQVPANEILAEVLSKTPGTGI